MLYTSKCRIPDMENKLLNLNNLYKIENEDDDKKYDFTIRL